MDFGHFMLQMRSAASFYELLRRLQGVDGHMLDVQCFALQLLAADGPGSGAIVELGSFKGKSTICLALGAKGAGRELVYAVDHFQGSTEHQEGEPNEDPTIVAEGTTYHSFLTNIAAQGVQDQVVPVPSTSAAAARRWDKPVRLLFIDADHSYESSRADFEAWAPHVVDGGLIVFHDIGTWEGVTQFYNELVTTDLRYRPLVDVVGMAVVEKLPLEHVN